MEQKASYDTLWAKDRAVSEYRLKMPKPVVLL